MPILVKRYPNRKLYDTAEKQYISLEGINDLIRQGEEIKVIDNVTGEDLTAVILSQVILENEKKRIGFLPHTVLTGLIQSGGTTLNFMRRGLSSSFESLTHFDDEIKRRIGFLVDTGDLTLGEAEELVQKLLAVGQQKVDLFAPIEKALRTVLTERGIASRNELLNLSKQVEGLSAKLDEFSEPKSEADDQD
ncbi:MAG: hypothetical protein A2032_04795 [Chloroflexi bacterium RBG_19FT_COMBO_49_13]|nr:MAG: hypothetical protein A2032_04795 [Chloroflexi bacterium RBG_19FT_COMBO_49_13]